jgi:hypothetical protein
MIIIRFVGGLGNQMFQYAMARALSNRHGSPLFIDASLCAATENLSSSGLALRPYELDVFKIQGQMWNGECEKKFFKIRKEFKFRRDVLLLFCKSVNMFSETFMPLIYERKDVGFDKSILRLPDNVCLQGYFPSFKYFDSCRDMIREDFIFNTEPGEQNRKMIDEMASVNSVSVHVRRGDYITSQKANDKFGMCSLSYYKKSLDYIANRIENPHFFVFSNDAQWVSENIKIDYPTRYVTHNTGNTSYEDMRLMSHCKHNIIANSSFGWWGAWLNDNPEKIVVAPSPAFDKLSLKDDDFIPDEWIRIAKHNCEG